MSGALIALTYGIVLLVGAVSAFAFLAAFGFRVTR